MHTTTTSSNLIYELIDNQPIHYQGYKSVLAGQKNEEELMVSSKLQAFIIAELIFLLRSALGNDYLIFTNELGVQFSKKSWRATDIAIIKAENLPQMDNKYLEVAPEMVIEIDTKAEFEDVKNPLGYYQEKTEQLLDFGVQKVVWIFTETEKILIAEAKKPRVMYRWTDDIQINDNLEINLHQVIQNRFPKVR